MKQKFSKPALQMLAVGALAVGVALWFFVIVPLRRRRAQAQSDSAVSSAAVAQAKSKPKNTTPRFPLVWLEYNPNTYTLQEQINVYAAKFINPATKGKVRPIAVDGYLGPETVGAISVWFPTVARDVTTSKTLSNAQFAIIMKGPATSPVPAK